MREQLAAELDRVERRADEIARARRPAKIVSRPVAPRSPSVERPIEARKALDEAEEGHAGSGRLGGPLVDAFVAGAKAGEDLVADGAGGGGEVVDGLAGVEDLEAVGHRARAR